MGYNVILDYVNPNAKIKAIKLTREITGYELARSKDAVDMCPSVICENIDIYEAKRIAERFSQINCRALVKESQRSSSVNGDEDSCKVILDYVNPSSQIKAIKLAREITGYDLVSSKELIESYPSVICQKTDINEAEKIAHRFAEIDCHVKIENIGKQVDRFTQPTIRDKEIYRSNRCPRCGGVNAISISGRILIKLTNKLLNKDYQWECGDCRNKW